MQTYNAKKDDADSAFRRLGRQYHSLGIRAVGGHLPKEASFLAQWIPARHFCIHEHGGLRTTIDRGPSLDFCESRHRRMPHRERST